MKREYIRMDPDLAQNMLEDGRSMSEIGVFVQLLGCAESQTPRGRFLNRKVLAGFLGQNARYIDSFLRHGDLIQLPNGGLYVDGWDEWQEGDWKVAERARRIRNRERKGRNGPPDGGRSTVTHGTVETVTAATPATVTGVTPPTVTVPSDRDRDRDYRQGQQGVEVTSDRQPVRQASAEPHPQAPTWSKGARLAEQYLRDAERLEASGK